MSDEAQLTDTARRLLAAVLDECEALAAASGLTVVVVAAIETTADAWEVATSLPEDRALASKLLDQAKLELMDQVGLATRS